MIDSALEFINDQLNQFLTINFGLDDEVTVLNNLVESNGSEPLQNQNKVIITLINLEQETAKQFYGGQVRSGDQVATMSPAVHFNLDVLVTASFDNYNESLKFLTSAVGYFQANNVFNRKNQPSMPEGIEALHFEIENTPYEKTHNLWSALGAKYQPSIIYKVRHVTVQSEQVHTTVKSVEHTTGQAIP
ncbi:MAG: hypothetical protein COA42_06355 [Alteromonadaceae bacterium]|nr:MAG: hypothetical protein COA42_06355 [Alteromonadaceae bacterium]